LAALTYAQLIAQITDRLNRDDLDTAARTYAVDRVDYYKREAFYAGQAVDTSITLVAGDTHRDLPEGWEAINGVRVLVGNWLTLTRESTEFFDAMDVVDTTVRGVPTYWTTFGSQVRIYPAAGAAYSLELTMDLPPSLPDDAASNFWTGDAKSLVIAGTIAEIYEQHLHSVDKAAPFRAAEERELTTLWGKTIRHRGGIQPRAW
jgi:hypothetical protein